MTELINVPDVLVPWAYLIIVIAWVNLTAHAAITLIRWYRVRRSATN